MDKHKIIPKDDRFEIEYFSVFRNRTTVTSTANREARIKTEPGEEFHSSRNENEDDKRQDVEADKIKVSEDASLKNMTLVFLHTFNFIFVFNVYSNFSRRKLTLSRSFVVICKPNKNM